MDIQYDMRFLRKESITVKQVSILILFLAGGGTWTEDEVEWLVEAVYQVTKTAEDQPVPFHGIHWPDVAKIVKTRHAKQCRQKW